MQQARVVRGSEGETYGPKIVFKHGSRTGAPFDFMIAQVPYLSGPPLHVHAEQHDTFYVLDGILTLQIGEEVLDLMPGDFASVPPGVAHTFDNIRKDQPPVKICNVMTPGGLDQFIVALNEFGSQDPAQFAATAEKHGSSIVGSNLGTKLGLTK
jgi:quercetin dioxygenase-like cupin family protein